MSILKTTLKVESTTLFPTPVSYTNVNNNEVSGDSSFGRLTVSSDSRAQLNISMMGAQGAFVYLKSPSTNPNYGAINIYNDSNEIISTLYSGDTGFFPLNFTGGYLYAQTSFGTAELDFVVANRGRDLGQSAIFYNYVGPLVDGVHFHQFTLVDVNSGVIKTIDTDFQQDTYTIADNYPVNGKGYYFRMFNGDTITDHVLLLDAQGSIVDVSSIFPSDIRFNHNYNSSYMTLDGKNVVFKWTDDGYTWIAIFDGERIYKHSFYNAYNVYPDYNYDSSTANGTIPVFVEEENGISGQETIYFIKGPMKVKVADGNYNNDYMYYDSYCDYFSNIVVLMKYNDDTGYYDSLKVYDTSGTLLKSEDLTSTELTNFDMYFYGSGKVFVSFYNATSINTPWMFYQYNQSTGVLIGENNSWFHTRTSNYDYVEYIFGSYDVYGYTNYKPESMAIILYSENSSNSDYITAREMNYCDVMYVVNNDTAYTTVNMNNVFMNPWGGYATDKEVSILWSTSRDSGELKVLRMTGVNTYSSFTIWDDLSTPYVDGWWDYEATGDYTLFATTGEDAVGIFTTMKVMANGAVLDTLRINNDYENNIRVYGNSIFYRTWGTSPLVNYYFNTSTKKWTQLTTFYSQRAWTPYGSRPNGLGTGKMVLFKPEYYSPTGSLKARILNNGVVTNEVDVTGTYDDSSWNYYISDDVLIVMTVNPADHDYWYIYVYDMGMNLLSTINTKSDSFNNSEIAAQRLLLEFDMGGSNYAWYSLNTLLSKVSIPTSDWMLNDTDWWD